MVISHDTYLFIGTSDYLMLGARRWVSPSHPLWKFTDVSGLQVLETEYQSNSPSPVVAIPAPKALQDQRFPQAAFFAVQGTATRSDLVCVSSACAPFSFISLPVPRFTPENLHSGTSSFFICSVWAVFNVESLETSIFYGWN